MTHFSDGQLLASYRGGNADAFTELVRRHQGALLRHARAFLGHGSPYEDVVQEVFLKLAREKLSLAAEGLSAPDLERAQLLAWLHTVTRNACMDVIRSESRRRHREADVAAQEATGGGIGTVEAEDTRTAVERELERLPEDQRDVLVLRLLAERSYREIADITGKKIGTVGWLISEGLKSLAQRLQPILQAEIGGGAAGQRAMRGGM